MNKELLEYRLELINEQIENYKKNTIEAIEKEEMIAATNYLLAMRDFKEQQGLINNMLEK